MMFKKLLVFLAIGCSFGMGYAAWRVASPALFSDPQAEEILDTIRGNLESIDTITADVDCLNSDPDFDFVDGSWAARGDTDFWIDMGTLGRTMWRNDIAFNIFDSAYMEPGQAGGLRWNDPDQDPFSTWGNLAGLIDIRAVLGMGEMHPIGLSLDTATHSVNGTTCNLLSNSDIKLYVDANHHHRLIRAEVDVVGTNELAFGTDFLQWQACLGGEYPSLIISTRPYDDGTISIRTYVLTNIQGQTTVPDSMFDLDFLPHNYGNLSF